MYSADTYMPVRPGWRKKIADALFPNFGQGALSVAILAISCWVTYQAVSWTFVHAVFLGTAADCRAALSQGACWAVVSESFRFILAGRYPPEEAWRPVLVVAMFLSLTGLSYFRFSWGKYLAVLWYGFVAASHLLLGGGFAGLQSVEPDQWGGFALTIVLATSGLAMALPLGIALALARRSSMSVLRSLSVTYIEVVRGVPFVAVLFLSSVMLPLLFPESFSPSKVNRACLAIGVFASAYIAEIVRGGLQTIPPGQLEAARALGMNYFATTVTVLLPQALRVTVPPMVYTMIGIFKDTSLVIVIGLTDFLGIVRLVTVDPQWRLFYLEPLIFAALIYFAFCWFISRIGFRMERTLMRRHAR